MHEYPLLIVERHLDTFGHVNNATYLELFEEARWDWIQQNGYGFDEIHRRSQGPTILEIHLRFKREVRNRQQVVIQSFVDSYEGKIGKLTQRMLDASRDVCCEAKMVFGLFDLTSRRLVHPTPEWLAGVGVTDPDTSPPEG
jgi:thioesterase-3